MFLRNLIRWILIKLKVIERPDLSARIVKVHPAPEEIIPKQVFVVGDARYRKWACFRCPGECGEAILLSLKQTQHPSWKVTIDWLGRPTIHPSVRQLNECKCHFWVRHGCVEWCADTAAIAQRKS